jgi:dipeptidyl aminopeptidase/acylaminoacyl peptidase
VSTVDAENDKSTSDLWRARYDGGRAHPAHLHAVVLGMAPALVAGRALARVPVGSRQRGRRHAALADAGRAAARRTSSPRPAGGVADFDWAPDSKRIALIAADPEAEPGAEKPRHAAPIVIDRYQFKDDDSGYLGARRKHLYVLDVGSGKVEPLTSGAHDEQLPAWSPDGRQIAYVTKRGDDPDRNLDFDICLIAPRAGAKERQLTTFPGSDLDPYWESRPSWSPDSKRIAYLQGGEDRDIYYAPGSSRASTCGAARRPCPRRSTAASRTRASRRTGRACTR